MMIHLGADHAGYKLKEAVKKWLIDNGYKVKDHGAFEYKKNDDYPDFIHPVGKAIAKNQKSRGIVFGGSGQGEAMVCNRHKGVRAAVYYGGSSKVITLSRQHNDANILALAGFFLKERDALTAVKLWLKTYFSGAVRHKRRIRKIEK